MSRSKYSTPYLKQALYKEIRLMKSLNSDYVVKLYDTVTTAGSHYLLMELCNGSNLTTLRKMRGGYLPEIVARVIIQQLVKGLKALNGKNIIHRDLKLDNVLVNMKTFPDFYG